MAKDRPTTEPLASQWKQSFRRRLLDWYGKHARDLPWRRDSDPYRVWLSEVMLQQTQVETVKPYFARFTSRFPTVADLAAADEQEVLRLWEGLGYYRRARGLHAAAKEIVSEHRGEFPSDVPTLRKLPGIGRYTAGAIASIAFGERAPILEANTIRLFTRLIAYEGDPTSSSGQKQLWDIAEQLLPNSRVASEKIRAFNQALMELGSLVCTPKAPRCEACPVRSLCQAHQKDVVELLQPTTKKLTFTELHEAAVVVWNNDKVLIRQCPPGERWAGLWDFPRFEVEGEGPLFVQQELAGKVNKLTGVECAPGALLKTIKHGVTRYRITLNCYEAQHTGGRLRSSKKAPVRWIEPEELKELPLSVTGRKIAKLLAAN